MRKPSSLIHEASRGRLAGVGLAMEGKDSNSQHPRLERKGKGRTEKGRPFTRLA
jgi:hypothetical protein